MQTIDDQTKSETEKSPRNWWRTAFFVALIAFEIARELVVMNGDSRVQSNATFQIYRANPLVVAEGTWKQIDGGGHLMTTATRIECWQNQGQCIEAYSNADD